MFVEVVMDSLRKGVRKGTSLQRQKPHQKSGISIDILLLLNKSYSASHMQVDNVARKVITQLSFFELNSMESSESIEFVENYF